MNANDRFRPSKFSAQFLLGCLACCLLYAHSLAASFTNLTLDSPNVAALVPSRNPALAALGVLEGSPAAIIPGWTLVLGQQTNPVMNYCDRLFASALPSTLNLSIHDPFLGSPGYCMFMGTGDGFGNEHDTWIAQSGEIPTDADRLALYVGSIVGFCVSLGGVRLDLIPDPDALRFYEVDVSPWKGNTVELRLGIDDSPFTGGTTLDILGFKTVVPEPGTSTLLLAGAGCLWLGLRRGVRRRGMARS